MSAAALLDAPAAFASAPRGRAAGGPRPTLEELLEESWRTARSHGETECPVCQAPMHLDNALSRCSGCGSTLS
jgi:hypothetical protein